MPSINPSDRKQHLLFSSLEDQLPEDSIVRVIDLLVDKLYTSIDIPSRKTEVGRPDYPRESLLKLFIYGYLHKVKSSRMLERECRINLEVLWLMGRLKPDHWTISNFRKEHGDEIKKVIREFVRFLKDTGFIEGKTIVVDGTKLRANASYEGVMELSGIKERIEDVDKKLTYYLETVNSSDEDENYRAEVERLKKEKEHLEAVIAKLKRKKNGKKLYIKGDPDSSVLKTREGKKPGYNFQIATDVKNKLIVASDISSETNDYKQLEHMYEKTKEALEQKPEEYIADAGYYTTDDIQKIEEEGVDVYISAPPDQTKGKFTYDKEKDEYTCANGKKLYFDRKGKIKDKRVRRYTTKECKGCPFISECVTANKKYPDTRTRMRYLNQEYRDDYRKRMTSEAARKKLKKRKAIIEHQFGIIKNWIGRMLLLRGLKKVSTEISLASLAYNILRVYNIDGYQQLVSKIEQYQFKTA
jgi:transposase